MQEVDELRSDRRAPKRQLEEGTSDMGKRSRIEDALEDLEQRLSQTSVYAPCFVPMEACKTGWDINEVYA